MSRTQRAPPVTTQIDSIKRNLDQISPETPNSKRMSTNNNMKSLKVSDMTVEQLLSVLASKEDFHEMKKEIQGLKDENKRIVDKDCRNLIIKINRVSVGTEVA